MDSERAAGTAARLWSAGGFKAHEFCGADGARSQRRTLSDQLCYILCSSACFFQSDNNSLITGFVSVNPNASYLVCADTPLHKRTDGTIFHYHPTD